MKKIVMPADAYFFFLKSIPNEEPALLPNHNVQQATSMTQYLKARDLWINQGWANLDFTGEVRLSPQCMRFIHALRHSTGMMKWSHQNRLYWLVRGPIDCLQITQEGNEVSIRSLQQRNLLRYLREELFQTPEGELYSKHLPDGAEAHMILTPTDTLAEDIVEHMLLL